MKALILVLLLSFAKTDKAPIISTKYAKSLNALIEIEDGVYEATVKHRMYGNGHYGRPETTYTLDVEVENYRVVAIDFGNGGSVHEGHNNEGYRYSGGALAVWEGVSATTMVRVDQGSTWKTFFISLNKED